MGGASFLLFSGLEQIDLTLQDYVSWWFWQGPQCSCSIRIVYRQVVVLTEAILPGLHDEGLPTLLCTYAGAHSRVRPFGINHKHFLVQSRRLRSESRGRSWVESGRQWPRMRRSNILGSCFLRCLWTYCKSQTSYWQSLCETEWPVNIRNHWSLSDSRDQGCLSLQARSCQFSPCHQTRFLPWSHRSRRQCRRTLSCWRKGSPSSSKLSRWPRILSIPQEVWLRGSSSGRRPPKRLSLRQYSWGSWHITHRI